MEDCSRRACHSVPVAGESVDRMTSRLPVEGKAALGKIVEEKKVSIAWVISDAITSIPPINLKKKGVTLQMSYPLY
jgi:hypothetical protein